jgi:NitT/TauT family transport system permease protein
MSAQAAPVHPAATEAVSGTDLSDQALQGLDRLELALPSRPSVRRRVWDEAWPKVAAILIALLIWEIVARSHWKPSYLLPGPGAVFKALWKDRSVVLSGTGTTLRQAVEFYLLGLALGTVLAIVITRLKLVRTAVSPLVSGLQTMPSVAWVPLAILIFGINQSAIVFVTVLGTTPAIIIGTISGIDAVPPSLLRVGQILGAKGVGRYWHVILPAALPGYVAGMKQGWAFAWRSLMAGELIVHISGTNQLGQLINSYQETSSAADLVAVMVVVLVVGLVMDTVVFSRLERFVLARRGLTSSI